MSLKKLTEGATGTAYTSQNHPDNKSQEFIASGDKDAANDHVGIPASSASADTPSSSSTKTCHSKIEFSEVLRRLYEIKAKGNDWQRTYDIPGRKRLREIVGEAYAVFMSIEESADPYEIFRILKLKLKGEKVTIHSDAPDSAVVVRTVFPSLDPNRVYKYARALDAAKSKRIHPSKFVAFVQESGGFEKIRVQPVLMVVPPTAPAGKGAAKRVSPSIETDVNAGDLSEFDDEALEYIEEMDALLRSKQSSMPIAESTLAPEQLKRLDTSLPNRIVLMAELHNGVLKVYEQVPYVEDALALAYRQSYPTCEDIHQAITVTPANVSGAPVATFVTDFKSLPNLPHTQLALTYNPTM